MACKYALVAGTKFIKSRGFLFGTLGIKGEKESEKLKRFMHLY